jgi:hypothetical protein
MHTSPLQQSILLVIFFSSTRTVKATALAERTVLLIMSTVGLELLERSTNCWSVSQAGAHQHQELAGLLHHHTRLGIAITTVQHKVQSVELQIALFTIEPGMSKRASPLTQLEIDASMCILCK